MIINTQSGCTLGGISWKIPYFFRYFRFWSITKKISRDKWFWRRLHYRSMFFKTIEKESL